MKRQLYTRLSWCRTYSQEELQATNQPQPTSVNPYLTSHRHSPSPSLTPYTNRLSNPVSPLPRIPLLILIINKLTRSNRDVVVHMNTIQRHDMRLALPLIIHLLALPIRRPFGF